MIPTSLPPLFSLTNSNLPSVGLPTDISVELVILKNSFVNFLSIRFRRKKYIFYELCSAYFKYGTNCTGALCVALIDINKVPQ